MRYLRSQLMPPAQTFILVSGATGVGLALLVLVGWCTGSTNLLQALPTSAPMQFKTAFAFLLCGLAFLLHLDKRTYLAAACSVGVCLIALLTLGQYLFGVDLSFDEFLIERYVTGKTTHLGRMAPNTALLFLFSGLALALLNLLLKKETGTKQRLARIVENSINEVYVFDAATFKFMEVNASATTNIGYSREELKELTPIDLSTKYSRKDFEALVRPLRRGERDCIRFDMVHRRKDGTEYDVEVVLQQIRSDDGEAFAAIIEDVTQKNRAEEQLRQAQKMEAVGQLTGGLAHDFNNLLGVILGNLQLIERSVQDSEKSKTRIKAALKAVEKGAELTRRLLAFARRQKLDAETIEPNPLIENLSDLLKHTLGEKIALECRLAENIPSIRTDPHQLEAAILNLAVNARDAMPDGGNLTIESDVIHLDEDHAARDCEVTAGNYVVLAVTDTGVGIPADRIDEVFEPFFTTKEVGQGSGLGLSMVYGFIKQSGGHVRIYSEVGRGTTVRMYVPVEDHIKFTTERPSVPTVEEVGGEETILVVEDQEDVREVAVALLDDLGYKVFEAENGLQGLAVLESKSEIDLLLTDIVMPGGIDGVELARAAHKLRPGLPVLFTTGYAAAAVLREAEVKAACNLVTKPYRRADLAAKIRQALDGQAAASEGVLTAAE